MRALILVAGATLALAACGDNTDRIDINGVENESGADNALVQPEPCRQDQLKPGELCP